MTILALDLGTTTGYAYAVKGQVFHSAWSFKPSRYDGGGMRYLRFRKQLEEFNHYLPVTELYYEEVRRHRGTDAAHVYGGLLGVLTAWCEENKVPYEGIPVGAIKKFWTGKGNADKNAMLAEAKRRGYDVEDDNACDALAILVMKTES